MPHLRHIASQRTHTRWRVWLASFCLVFLFAAHAFAGTVSITDDTLDRTTPRRAYEGFREAASDGDYERAAKYLDLRAISKSRAETLGPELARDLAYVIERRLPIDPSTIVDSPDAGGTSATVTIGSLYVDEEPIYLSLTHVKFQDGVSRWLFAKSTVNEVPQLDDAFGPTPWEDRIPRSLRAPEVLGNAPWQWVGLVVAALAGVVLGRVSAAIVAWLVVAFFKRWRNKRVDTKPARPALRAIVAVLVFRAIAHVLALTVAVDDVVSRATTTLLLLCVAWFIVRSLGVAAAVLEEITLADNKDEHASRGLRTQLTILQRIASIVVGVLALAAVLLQFQGVRSVGTSLLASAGVAGLVLGLAAQKSLGAIIAGIQLSLAQPVRIGDTVVMDGQAGKVEELHLTYGVVKLFDERRLIVPIVKFLESSFENWTRQGTDLRGEVLLTVDYKAPIERVRAELEEACKQNKLWDKRVCELRVSDSTDRGIVLRALISARNADELLELRYFVRERLVKLVASIDDGQHFVRARSEVISPAK